MEHFNDDLSVYHCIFFLSIATSTVNLHRGTSNDEKGQVPSVIITVGFSGKAAL